MRIKSQLAFLLLAMFSCSVLNAQKQQIDIQRIEPAFWWAGMKNSELQLLIYGKDISYTTISLQYEGVTIKKIEKVENPNYQFIYLEIASATKPGTFPITFQLGKKKKVVNYEIKNRTRQPDDAKGFNAADVIYLITPDRFANGDEKNDNAPGMLQLANRSDAKGRHGGDIKGIEDHLDYISDLGVTAVWINPLQENNQPKESYHGYAITDFYKIDPRFGTNESYNNLVRKFHEKGMKVVMDMVFNHCGNEHWFIKDLPSKDWIHQFPEFTKSNFRTVAPTDPYASTFDVDRMQQGWFDNHMPDLNQHNTHLGTYLIQNSIWWIEYSQLDGIRMDTHGYNYSDFMATWGKTIMTEYPNFNIVGEVWDGRVTATSFYQPNAKNYNNYQGYLPSVTDFPLMGALNRAFNEKDEWEQGMATLYYTLVADGVYTHPNNNVTFLDNHDLSRFATTVGGDVNKQKMAFAALLTLRGIPQLYYGCEIGMKADKGKEGDGKIRADMPGGWKGDTRNVFAATGRTAEENELFNYLQTLLNWRKTKAVVQTGKLMHFVPENGAYVYFRYSESESVMVILNNNNEPKTIDTKRFNERLNGYSSGKNIITGEIVTTLQTLTLPAKSATIIELIK